MITHDIFCRKNNITSAASILYLAVPRATTSCIFSILILLHSISVFAAESGALEINEQSEYTRHLIFPFHNKAHRERSAGNFRAAEENYKKILGLDPGNIDARISLGEVQIKLEKNFEAIENLSLVSGKSEFARNLLISLYKKTLDLTEPKYLKKLLSLCIPSSCTDHLSEISYNLSENDGPDSAGSFLTQAIALLPNNFSASLLSLRSAYDEKAGNWKLAVEALEEVGTIRPLNPKEAYRLGIARINLGQPELAIQYIGYLSGPPPELSRNLSTNILETAIHLSQKNLTLDIYNSDSIRNSLSRIEARKLGKLLSLHGYFSEAEELYLEGEITDCREFINLYAAAKEKEKLISALASCDESVGETEWLQYASNIGTIESLSLRTLSGQLEIERIRALSDAFIELDMHQEATQALGSLPENSLTLSMHKKMAYSLEKTTDKIAAAESFYSLAQRLKDNGSHGYGRFLERSSDLYAEAGKESLALYSLGSIFPFEGIDEENSLNSKLLNLISKQRNNQHKEILRLMYRRPFPETMAIHFADVWGDLGSCRGLARFGTADIAVRNVVILARCYEKESPGLASYYYQIAIDKGFTEVKHYLAYSQHRSGDFLQAVNTWKSIPENALSQENIVAAATSALAANQLESAEGWWRKAADTTNEEWWLLGTLISRKRNRPNEALERVNQGISLSEAANPILHFNRSLIRRQIGDSEGARSDEQLLKGLTNALSPSQYAHLALTGEKSSVSDSIECLKIALSAQPENEEWRAQLAYLNQQAGNRAETLREVKTTIARLHPEIAPHSLEEPAIRQKLADLRSMHSRISRKRTFHAGAWSGRATTASDGIAATGDPFSWSGTYVSYEHLLPDRTGKSPSTFTAYGRAMKSWTESHEGDNALLAGIGIRWQPLLQQDLNFYAEMNHREHHSGFDSTELMMRATGALASNYPTPYKWIANADTHFGQLLYLDAAYWAETNDYAYLARYSVGPYYQTPIHWADLLQPYGFFQLDGSQNAGTNPYSEIETRNSSAGFGLAWYLWTHEDRYNTHRNSYIFRLEYQSILDSLQQTGNGLFLKMEAFLQ
ncbi:NfrA family protein [Biformimicrobium ophioploci]|uniref:Bacteriophage N4 adsorption protein A C-terminal domain-containing protein n=1 Tax=Biformimicrobium ophioploci TaxID=3036711 RepID=A0ABQ6LXJ2_9GAMM|nr:hypothetical protein [Microbulbifer sp. NKW57]GMG86781.1 hypothetical protein MNKW57_11020 [Microbulbifer sp. NKW57]